MKSQKWERVSVIFVSMMFSIAVTLMLVTSVQAATLNVPTPYTSIQAAVNAATGGDIIEVDNGTYYENVNVNKAVTIQAKEFSSPIVDGGGSGSCFNVYTSAGLNNVTINGFEIRNAVRGIWIYGSGASTTTHTNVSLDNNDIHSHAQNGILTTDTTVNNLTISGNSIDSSGVGISFANNSSVDGLIVENNVITNNDVGLALWVGTFSNVTVADCYFEANAWEHIDLGITWQGPADISDVLISGCQFLSGGGWCGVYAAAATLTNIKINFNEFITDQWGVFNETESVIDALYNWWGDVSGPYNPWDDDTLEQVNEGSGDIVSEYVLYDPWIGQAGMVTGGGSIVSPPGAYKLNDFNVPTVVWDQGFEIDDQGWFDSDDTWYGTVTRVMSGTSGVISSAGLYHAVLEGDSSSAPFTRFDGYRDEWLGTWVAEIDIYLNPNWAAGQGFDYSVAASGSDGNHQRDYIFHVTKDTTTDNLLVAGSNNTNFAPREDLENINHYEVTSAGWYTFQHVFYEDSGALAVDLNLLDSDGNILFTETRYNAADIIPDEVGGNLYGWFTFINVSGGIAVDEHQLTFPTSPEGKANFGFVAKNKKTQTPDGNTEFMFKAVNLNFHSSSYDFLIVNKAESRAQFKGSGTINGVGAYKFMLWATDGDPNDSADTFRIKIWEEDGDGNETVVYDNGAEQAIASGSIVVHTNKK
jgi:hypothetical protein